MVPHAAGAKRFEKSTNLTTVRYRYFVPAKMQDIANGGGVDRIQKTPVYALKLAGLLGALFVNTLYYTVAKRIDILNPHWTIPQGFMAVLVKFVTGKKIALTVHGGDIFNLTGSLMTKVKRFVLKRCDVVCVNSTATKKACEAIYQRDYQVIPIGIDMEKFSPISPSQRLKKQYNLDTFTVLFVGRLAEVKGVIYLCQALKKLADEGKEFRALIAGDGPLKSELEAYVAANDLADKVVFVGWVDQADLSEYYSVADVFVGPSLSEPQGLVFVEALAMGVPVIASRVGGIVDIVAHEKNGYLVPVKSGSAIADHLSYMIDHPEQVAELRRNTRKMVSERFSWDVTMKSYEEIFETL